MVAKLTENQKEIKDQKKEKLPPIKEWIKKIKFQTTKEIEVPERLLDQVIGQDKTVDIVKKLLSRNVM